MELMEEHSQLELLRSEIRLLENQIRALRYSRRVLMNMLRFTEQQRLTQVAGLQREIEFLKHTRIHHIKAARKHLT